ARLRHGRELLPRPYGIAHDVDAPGPGRPSGRPDAGRQHPHRRRLPRSVWAEETEHLSRGDEERHAVDGVHRRLGVPLHEVENLDGWGCGVLGKHLEIVRIARKATRERRVRHTGAMRRGVWLL